MREERFLFYGPEETIAGIDENGYGPLIGPLIITGIQIQAPFDSIYSLRREILGFNAIIEDSKKIFKRNLKSYKKGEEIARYLIKLAGKTGDDFFSLIKSISTYEPHNLINFKLPVWEKDLDEKGQLLPEIKIKDIYVEIIDAPEFNSLIKRFDNKAFVDFLGFKRVREKLPSKIYFMGKIGGTKFYRNFFFVGGEDVKVIEEKHHISYYKIGERELYFLLNGDEEYLPIMLAGILGKYIRELFMKSISELFGFKDSIPFASGYRHDPKTQILKKEILKRGLKERFIRDR